MLDGRRRQEVEMSVLASRSLTVAAVCVGLAVSAAGEIDPDRLAGLEARNVGPAGMSGRIAVIEAAASDPSLVYVGAATGGVWKSTNAGLTWTPVFDDQPVHAIGALSLYQPNPDLVWVGTGEGNVRNSASIGNGVYRSVDGGKTWRHLGLEKTERIHRVVLHPSHPDLAYVCALGQEWGENPERGVFKTEDGGRTWRKVLYVDEKTGCAELVMDPKNPGKLFAAMWEFRRWPHFFKSGGPGSGLHVSHDGGATWKRLQEEDGLPKGELGRMGIAISASNPEVVYVLAEAKKSALLRSDDGGRSFKTVNDKPNVAGRPFYYADIRVDPAWPQRVYSLETRVRVSDDGGRSLEVLPGAAQIHGDYHALWIDPGDPRHLYIGEDGGMGVSHDRGKTFRFVANLPLAQYYHVAVDGERPYNLYGGLQDNGSWRGPAAVWARGGIRNHLWQNVGGGDGFDVQPHPQDAQTGYSLWQGGNLMRWDLRTGTTKGVKPPEPAGVKLRFNWNAAIALDPREPDTLYLGSQFVHRSRDRGESWETISPDLTTNRAEWQKQEESGGLTPDVTAAENLTTLLTIAPSPLEPGLIWTGSDDGRIHLTRDAGKTWTSLEANLRGVPANTWIPHVEASRFDAGTVFVVLDNHRRSDPTPYAYRTDDFGRTFRSLVTPTLRGYCLSIEQDPVRKDLLYLGTEFGLYVSLDGGRSWTHLKRTLPTASVMDLVVHPRDGDLVIATHGRALWVLDDVGPLRTLSEAALAEPLRLFEIADAQQAWRRRDEGGFGLGAGEFRGESRPYGAILTYSLNLPGLPVADEEKERARKEEERRKRRAEAAPEADEPEAKRARDSRDEAPQVQIEVADASGAVIRSFKAPARLGINRAVWNLGRDAFKEPPRAEDAPRREEEPSGPEVPPGTYDVKVSYAGHQASQSVRVLADPRSRNATGDWTKRWDAILRAGALHDRAVDAIGQIRRLRADVASVQQKARQAAESAGEKDKAKLDELPVVKAGEPVKEALGGLEKRLWQSPETKGIVARTHVFARIQTARGYLESSWDAPSAVHLEHLARAEAELSAVLADLAKFLETTLAAYRKQAQDAGIALLR
jgi:photosystem II stability/assembly factor-like uncharacterized protein